MKNCQKKRYPKELDAKIALFSTSTRNTPKRREKRYYRCPQCHGWHLTSK